MSEKRKWIFPTTPCPRCHGYNTEATHTDSGRGIQYRRCRMAVCRKRFSVRGEPVETPAPAAEKKHVCPHCGKKYARPNGLTRHINSKHGGLTHEPGTENGNDGERDATRNPGDRDAETL